MRWHIDQVNEANSGYQSNLIVANVIFPADMPVN